MTLPLFTDQPQCRDRLMCGECRDPADDTYRRGWAARYTMPILWPQCPAGVPVGYKPPPAPVPPSLVALALDEPGSPAAQETEARVRQRTEALLPICRTCPGGHYRGDDGAVVDCDRATPRCCGARKCERGLVHLGCGSCTQGYFAGAARAT